MERAYVLGIDAGGTKTVGLLADEQGRVLGEARGGGANLQTSGELEVEKVLHLVMEEAIGDRGISPAAICLGIAGVDRPRDADAIHGIMRRIGAKARTIVVNDALVALVAGAGYEPALVVVAGTGSIAYGRNAEGRAARSGGWGYLLGDEGGGFWIGRLALSAVVQQSDGRGPETALTELVLDGLGLGHPTGLVHLIYDAGIQRGVIASVAAMVQRAADRHDPVAVRILQLAATELTSAAAAVISSLHLGDTAFPIVLAGGIFRGIPTLVQGVTTRLAQIAPLGDIRPLQVEPAVGAVRLALDVLAGRDVIPRYQ